MQVEPLLSFVLVVDNHREYVAGALRSILAQTVQDFEVVVLDDASVDDSLEVVRSFADGRIRTFRNEQKRGRASSYNRAIELARGQLIANLDPDDWIEPHKCERQLKVIHESPRLDILGSFIRSVDRFGDSHTGISDMDERCNQKVDLNHVDTWVVRNPLCLSTTIVRRQVYDRAGPYDSTIAYTWDWEFWTRALRHRCQFEVIPERLCYFRSRAARDAERDSRARFLEISFLLCRNLLPLIEQRNCQISMSRVLAWLAEHEQFARLRAPERYRLVASMIDEPPATDWGGYAEAVLAGNADPRAEAVGRRCLALFYQSSRRIGALRYHRDSEAYERLKKEYILPQVAELQRVAEAFEGPRRDTAARVRAEDQARIQELERAAQEYERAKREYFVPRIEQLEHVVDEFDRAKRDYFVPRIEQLEHVVAEFDHAKREYFVPRIAHLEAMLGDLEQTKETWFLPRIEALERQVLEYKRRECEYYEPKIAELEGRIKYNEQPEAVPVGANGGSLRSG